MQKKDDKVGNKTANSEERQRTKEEREGQIRIDSQQKSKFWPVRMREKQKKAFDYVLLVGKYAFYVAKLTLSHPYANQPKNSPKKRKNIQTDSDCSHLLAKMQHNLNIFYFRSQTTPTQP